MKNISGIDESDEIAINRLMHKAATNEWYMLAEHLRRARDEAGERIKWQWEDGVLHDARKSAEPDL